MAQKVLVITSGTEAAGVGIAYLHQVRARPSSQLHTMVCSIDTDNLSVHYTNFREDEWLHLSIPQRYISMVRRDPDSDLILKEILYPGIMPTSFGGGGGGIRYNTAGAIIINRELVKNWLLVCMNNLIASNDGWNNLKVVIVVSAAGATGSGTLERLIGLVISAARDAHIPEPIPLDVFILQPGAAGLSTLNLANTLALYLEGAVSRLVSRIDAEEVVSNPFYGRVIMVDWGTTIRLETLDQLRQTAATLIRLTHDPVSSVTTEIQRTAIDHHVLRALDEQTNLPSYLSTATPVTITLGNLEEQIIQSNAVKLVNYLVLGEQTMEQNVDTLLSEAEAPVAEGPLLDALTHLLQGSNADERYEYLVEQLTQQVSLMSLQNTTLRLERRTAQQQAQKLRSDWISDKERIPSLADDIRQRGSDLQHQTFQLINAARRGAATTLSLRELRSQYRAIRQIVVETLACQPFTIHASERQVVSELERLKRTRLGRPRPEAAIATIQANLRGMVQHSSHTIAQTVLSGILTHCDQAISDLGLVLARLSRQLQSNEHWKFAQQQLTINTNHPLELPALAEKEIEDYAELVGIFSTTRRKEGQGGQENLLCDPQEERVDLLTTFRKSLQDEDKLDLLFAGNVKELYDVAFTFAAKYIHNEVSQHSVLTTLQRAGDGVLVALLREAIARAQIMVPIDRSFTPELEEKLLISAHWENTMQQADFTKVIREGIKQPWKLLPSKDPNEIIVFYYADGIPMSAVTDLTGRCLEQFLLHREHWYKQERSGRDKYAHRIDHYPVYSGRDMEALVAQTGVLRELHRIFRQNSGKYDTNDVPELGV